MSRKTCLVLDSQPGLLRHLFNSGKDLVEFDEALDSLAQRLAVRPLSEFISFSRAEAIEILGEDYVKEMEAAGELQQGRWRHNGMILWSLETEWFLASEGLKTVTALLNYVRDEPTCLGEEIEEEEDAEGVVLALEDIRELLVDAEAKQRRFHMTGA